MNKKNEENICLDILLFELEDKQTYGINVLRIREIIKKNKINKIPKSDKNIIGVISFRDKIVPVLKLYQFLEIKISEKEDNDNGFIIISECENKNFGLTVKSVKNIVHINFNDLLDVPENIGEKHYLDSVINLNGKIIQILDIKKIIYNQNKQLRAKI